MKIENLKPDSLIKLLTIAIGLLMELVDDEECSYDHHDYCQTHSLHEKPCPVDRARELLKELEG